MKLRYVVLFLVVLSIAAVGVIRQQQMKRYTSEELDLSGQQRTLAAGEPSAAAAGWPLPIGEYWLTVAMDRSGSITPAERRVGDSIVHVVADSVEGSNILQVAAFANKYETFGSADTEQGRAEVLSRWKRAIQYPADIQKTNIALTADNLVRDAVPNIKAGRLAQVIIITDGDHDPPEGQDDYEMIASVQGNLDAIPEAYRDWLRVHIIEVGSKIKFAGAVERDIFMGRAKTIRADAWDDVLPIVLQLQADLVGRFNLDLPNDQVEIGVPSADKPKILGQFYFDLVGPAVANVQLDFASESPDAGEQLLASVRVNSGEWIRLPAELKLGNDSRLEFSFYENPAEELPDHWFSAFDRKYRVMVAPSNNLMALSNEGDNTLYISLHRDSIFRRYWWAEVLIGVTLFVLLVKRIRTIRRRNREDMEDEHDDELAPIRVQHQGQDHVLQPPEAKVGQVTFLFQGGSVLIRPDCLVLVEFYDNESYSKRQETVSAGETYPLPDSTEVTITDVDHNTYQITYTQQEVFA